MYIIVLFIRVTFLTLTVEYKDIVHENLILPVFSSNYHFITVYAESASGIKSGGRTGLSSVVTGLLFLLVIFLQPIFCSVPACAAAPAAILG